MVLNPVDWLIVAAYFLLSLLIGLYSFRKSGESTAEFFLSGRNMPWWLLGFSMVATTFSCDTPNLVTDIVRQNGVSGNWAWWAFLLTGMLTVFIYARLWRRSGVLTDLEFYELRYSGKMAAFLRGFRAIYLGFLFNIFIIALVSLALIKIGAVMLHWDPLKTMVVASVITVVYSALGGFKSIILTDFFQFILAMAGAVAAAVFVVNLPEVGGLSNLLHDGRVSPRLDFFPDFSDRDALLTLLVLPLAVQWWSVWYPGSEPGGGGYIAQRMLSAKNEKGAVKATLFFNVVHYALRPWPWIIVALASLILYPTLEDLQQAFPYINPQIMKHDLAYPAMLSHLPNGLLGMVVAALLAAYMSTVSTHLNWGSSYLVNDFYRRFIRHGAGEKHLVLAGRLSTVLLMVVAAVVALLLENAFQAFTIVLQIGAGTGLIYILRWFWWRVNAWSEVTAMIVSFAVALYFQFLHPLTGLPAFSPGLQLVAGVIITTAAWVLVTFLTRPARMEILKKFCLLVHPGGPGWKRVTRELSVGYLTGAEQKAWDVPRGILCMLAGCLAVYASLFSIGNFVYGRWLHGAVLLTAAAAAFYVLLKLWGRIRTEKINLLE
jgi:Na+/proline symporter